MRKPLTQIAFDFGPAPDTAQEEGASLEDTGTSLLITGTEETEEAPVEYEMAEPAALEPAEAPVIVREKKVSTRGRRSLRENSLKADLVDIPDDEELFKKAYYPIGEVARMFGENQSLIRFWESEFDILKPRKNKKGDRYFRPVDIKNLVLIHDLLRRRKFTIEGAKDYLRKNKRAEEKFALIQSLQKMKEFFLELKASL